jgi:hypothetical protein
LRQSERAANNSGIGQSLARLLIALSAGVCLALAYLPAQRATIGLSMPYDPDQFREIAYVEAGRVVSVLAAIMFFIAVARLLGGWIALLALALQLFAPPHNLPAWIAPAVTV